jgi:hypothetical protein
VPKTLKPLDYAKAKLTDVLTVQQAGQKGTTGVAVKGHFFIENGELLLGLNVEN